MGFRNGSRYKLNVETLTVPLRSISVQSIGVLNRGAVCVYNNVILFLDNWTEIKTD